MQLNPEEIASQRIALMGHVEEICEKQGLVPSVEFNVVDVGNQYDLEYSPEYDEVDLPAVPIILPVVLTFIDSRGVRLERTLHDRQKGGSFPAARSGGRPLEHHLYWLWVVAQWDRRWPGILSKRSWQQISAGLSVICAA